MPIYQKKRDGKAVRGSYRVVIWMGGISREQTFHGTKKAAAAFEARWRLKVEAEGPADTRVAPTFSDFSTTRYKSHAKKHLKDGTWRNRKYQIAMLVEHFCDLLLTQINTEQVEQFQDVRQSNGIGAVTINDDTKVLMRILSYARSKGIPASNPKIDKLPEVTNNGRVMCWTAQEVDTLYKAFAKESPALLPITVVLLNTGLRKGEALALEWSSIDLERGQIKIHPSEHWTPKNGKPREIPIGSAILPWLSGPRLSDRWVFPSSTGNRYKSWPQAMWDRARKAANVGGSPHICRHTYASHFLASCPDLFLLAQVLGHSQARVTELYSHLLPDHLERARNAVVLPTPVDLRLRATKLPPQVRRKLRNTQVAQLRIDYEQGTSQQKLAADYGIATSTVHSIVNNKTYIDCKTMASTMAEKKKATQAKSQVALIVRAGEEIRTPDVNLGNFGNWLNVYTT